MTDLPDALRGPARTGVLIGASSALFAVTLAGVATLQQADERATLATRDPALALIARRSEEIDRLVATLEAGSRAERAAVGEYGDVTDRLLAFEAALATLDADVAVVAGAADALPERVRLPVLSVPRRTVVAPRTHATTGASGAP